MSDSVTLEFIDFADLQTRLMLLPRVEEEGIGAVIESYYPSLDDENEKVTVVKRNLTGFIVQGVQNHNDLQDKEFSTILASIRESPSPILLSLASPTAAAAAEMQQVQVPEAPKKISSDHSYEEEKKTDTEDQVPAPQADSHAEQHRSFSFSSASTSLWTKRFRETSMQFASGAAASAANMARAANERAAKMAAAAKEQQQQSANILSYAICKQSNQTGEFIRIPQQITSNTQQQNVDETATDEMIISNSSLLSVRLNVTQACPVQGQTFQWYRGSDDEQWQPLEGADRPVFQPSATEVGYKLKCVITIPKSEQPKPQEKTDEPESDNESDSDDDSCSDCSQSSISLNDHQQEQKQRKNAIYTPPDTSNTIECQTLHPVSADLQLFNGARQALVRGAHFAGLQGLGNAEGRNFRLKIYITHRSKKSKKTACAVTIYQVAGNTAEPIHSEENPLLCLAANTDASHAKNFNLMLISPDQANEKDAAMVAALSTPTEDDEYDGFMRFRLQASNRLARESLLLAIGIANYSGKPADLHESMILYKHQTDSSSDSLSSSSASSRSPSMASASLADDLSHASFKADEDHSEGSSHSSTVFFTPTVSTPSPVSLKQRSISLDRGTGTTVQTALAEAGRTQQLEQELQQLREKMARKDKVVSELQRAVAQADDQARKAQQQHKSCQEDLQNSNAEKESLERTVKQHEQTIQNYKQEMEEFRQSFKAQQDEMQKVMTEQANKIAELEKANRTLQNEKAVLSAAVEAREGKLDKMADLQESLKEANLKLAGQEKMQQEIDECNRRLKEVREDRERILQMEKDCRAELDTARAQISGMEQRLKIEKAKTANHKSELEKEQMKMQKLKAERNSYKQKGDSLSKEIARVCRNGRTIRDVEKILANDATRRHEVEVLREQKRKALEDLQEYRILLEQARMAQRLAGMDQDHAKVLERNAELERLLSELAEYVSAKEMQLDTMRQVNDALQTELKDLAKASMSKNEV